MGNQTRRNIGAAGVGESRRDLDASIMLASALQEVVDGKTADFVSDLPDGHFLLLKRHFDATPLMLGFGSLQQRLQPLARYLLPDDDRPGYMKVVSWNEFREARPTVSPHKGILELLAMEFTLCTSSGDGHTVLRTLLRPACILARATASVTWRALNLACPALQLGRLEQLAGRLRIVILCDNPDNSSVNNRVKRFVASRLPRNVVYCSHACHVHAVHNTISSACDLKRLTGDVHALYKVTRQPSYRAKLQLAAKGLVDTQPLLILPGAPPRPEWREHAERVMSHTLLRSMDHTRGSLCHDHQTLADPTTEVDSGEIVEDDMSTRRRAVATLLRFLNGDWTSERLVHYCSGCCRDEAHSREQVLAAIFEARLLEGWTAVEPSQSRWGSTTDALSEACAGDMVHGLLRQCIMRAFPSWVAGVPLDEDDEDERKMLQRRVYRCRKVLEDPGKRRLMALVSWCCEAVDYLWLHLEWVDERGGGLADLQYPNTNPFSRTQRELQRIVLAPMETSVLAPVVRHYGGVVVDDCAQIEQEAFGLVLSMLGQIFWRFEVPHSSYAFRLSRLVDARTEDQAEECRRFFAEPACCLDEDFALKVP